MTTIAFQGEAGAYSEEAARQHFGDNITALPCHAFEHIFEAIEQGRADYGMLPIENSTVGSINKSYDLVAGSPICVCMAKCSLRVRHCLLTIPGNAATIKQVRSHPQALAQCEGHQVRYGYTAVTGRYRWQCQRPANRNPMWA